METVIQGSTLQTLRAGLHAGDGGRGRDFSRPRSRCDAPLPDRRHLRQLYGARKRERREGKGCLRARGLDFERLIALIALKDRYDPQNVFRFNRNIAPSKAER
jgi:hypothetical protein